MLRELFGSGTATQERIIWLEEDPDSDPIGLTKQTSKFEKLAAFLPISDEMDEAEKQKYLDTRLPMFIRQAEDAWLMDKLLEGNLPKVRKLREVVGQPLGGLAPDTVLFHPADYLKLIRRWKRWHRLVHALAEHRLQLVKTHAVPRGMQIVGAFREGATVWQLGELTTEISDQHQDYFRSPFLAARATERLALTLYRPSAFRVIGKAA